MPRSKKPASAPPKQEKPDDQPFWLASDAPWGGFINVKVDDEQKEEFHLWCAENPDEGWRILDDLLGKGMKVGLSWDMENECYILTFTGALVANSTERYCTTNRAGTLGEVVALSSWKHSVLVAGNYGDLKANGRMRNWG